MDSSLPRNFPGNNWNGLPSPGCLPNPGNKLTSPTLAGRFFTTEPPGKPIKTPTAILLMTHLHSLENEDPSKEAVTGCVAQEAESKRGRHTKCLLGSSSEIDICGRERKKDGLGRERN